MYIYITSLKEKNVITEKAQHEYDIICRIHGHYIVFVGSLATITVASPHRYDEVTCLRFSIVRNMRRKPKHIRVTGFVDKASITIC